MATTYSHDDAGEAHSKELYTIHWVIPMPPVGTQPVDLIEAIEASVPGLHLAYRDDGVPPNGYVLTSPQGDGLHVLVRLYNFECHDPNCRLGPIRLDKAPWIEDAHEQAMAAAVSNARPKKRPNPGVANG